MLQTNMPPLAPSLRLRLQLCGALPGSVALVPMVGQSFQAQGPTLPCKKGDESRRTVSPRILYRVSSGRYAKLFYNSSFYAGSLVMHATVLFNLNLGSRLDLPIHI